MPHVLRRSLKALPYLLLLAVLLAGCWQDAPQHRPAPDEPQVPAIDTLHNEVLQMPFPRPRARVDTVYIEGFPEQMHLELVQVPSLFSTYVPAGDFSVEHVSSGEGTGLIFFVEFGRQRNVEAFLEFFFFDAQWEPNIEDVRALLVGPTGLARQRQWHVQAEQVQPEDQHCWWAINAYRFTASGDTGPGTGRICIGMHDNTPFYMIMRYPLEYGDGFLPRIRLILSEFRWWHTNQPLG